MSATVIFISIGVKQAGLITGSIKKNIQDKKLTADLNSTLQFQLV